MRIAVIGAGAVGGYFGGRLAAAREDVTFIARSRNLHALGQKGLRIDSPEGDVHLARVQATDNPRDVGAVDTIIVAVKAWQVAGIADLMDPLMGEQTAILPLQNGVEAAGQLAEARGERHVVGAMCRIVAMQVAPGRVKHVGVEPYVAMGELNNRRSPRVERIARVLQRAGVAAGIPPDIQSSIWQKFLFVAPVSGICALNRASVGVVRSEPRTRELLMQSMQEICDVAAARKVTLAGDAIGKTTDFLDGMPYEATPSMQRDIIDGRPSELEFLNGAVVRMGLEAGIETPVNRSIYTRLLPMENAARRG